MIPLGNLLAGAASAAYGIHETLVGMTVLGIGVSLAVASLPSVRTLPRATTGPDATRTSP
jgi:hypothetical protein